MDKYIISDDIYRESISHKINSYQISDELYKEAQSLDMEAIKTEIHNSYLTSGRYWILRLGTHKNLWRDWVKNGEIRLKAPGFYYLKSYSSLSAMNEEYEKVSNSQKGSMAKPSDYYTFAYRMQIGDILMVCSQNEVIGWGFIESHYLYSAKRTSGRHFRRISWHEIRMPYVFWYKRPIISLVPEEERYILKEALIEQITNSDQTIPLPFKTENKCKLLDKKLEEALSKILYALLNHTTA